MNSFEKTHKFQRKISRIVKKFSFFTIFFQNSVAKKQIFRYNETVYI
jgi:hypothetical protein